MEATNNIIDPLGTSLHLLPFDSKLSVKHVKHVKHFIKHGKHAKHVKQSKIRFLFNSTKQFLIKRRNVIIYIEPSFCDICTNSLPSFCKRIKNH